MPGKIIHLGTKFSIASYELICECEPLELKFYLWLKLWAINKHEAWPSSRTIQDDLGLDPPQLFRLLKKLEDKNRLKIIRNPGKNNTYDITWYDALANREMLTRSKHNANKEQALNANKEQAKLKETFNEEKKTTNFLEKKETDIQKIVNHFFTLKKWDKLPIEEIKTRKIIYARFVRPARDLLDLAGGIVEVACTKLGIIQKWADSQGIDWGIETVFKRWFDLDILPQEKKKRPRVDGCPAYQKNGKWFIILPNCEHKEYVGALNKIVYE